MGKKAARIAQLERDVAAYRSELVAVLDQNARLQAQVKRLASEARPSLTATAKREFRDKWEWLLDAVGVPS